MGRPRKGYFVADGTKVPSVTEILDRFKPSAGLIHWAYTQGKAGLDYRVTRDKAASAGSLAHAWIEATVKGKGDEFVIPSTIDEDTFHKAKQAHENFLAWYEKAGLVIVDTERPLVSEAHRFGGTYDAVATETKTGKLIALDFKTSNRIYHEHLYQVAAYGLLMVECTGYGWPDEYVIFQMAKDTADFTVKTFPNLDRERETFLAMRQAYDLVKQCEARKL